MPQISVLDLSVYGLEVSLKKVVTDSLSVYAIEPAVPSVNVRSADGYVMRDDPKGNNLRQAAGYALRSKRKPDFSKDAKTALYAAVQRDWGISLTSSTGYWANPRNSDPTSSFNSLVSIMGASGSGYGGSFDVRYDRYDITDAFVGKTVTGYSPTSDGTIYGKLAEINAYFGLALDVSDVQDGPVQTGKSFTLIVPSGSFYFLAGGQITIGPTS